jgi:hypothetical protein
VHDREWGWQKCFLRKNLKKVLKLFTPPCYGVWGFKRNFFHPTLLSILFKRNLNFLLKRMLSKLSKLSSRRALQRRPYCTALHNPGPAAREPTRNATWCARKRFA